MDQQDFTAKFHWMNGLSEYFRYTGQEDKYEPIFKALYHNNYYRKRDIIMHFIERDYGDLNDAPYELRRAWINMLLHCHLPDVEVKVELITSMLATLVDDTFTHRISRFIDYFLFDNDTDIMLPDLGDFLSRGQVKSKLWLMTELANIIEGPVGNIAFYGGWYNFLAHFFYEQFEVSTIYNFDINEDIVEPNKRLYEEHIESGRFKALVSDVSTVAWEGKNLTYVDLIRRDIQIERWMEKQENVLAEKRQARIDAWLEKNAEKIKQGLVDKKAVIENISADLRNEMFKNKEEVFAEFGKNTLENINMVINTSCEHMDNTWFDNLPDGTFVVLQTNDYFENEQHSNCCKDLEEAKSKYPMQNIFYEGELDTHLYNRFMLIGIK